MIDQEDIAAVRQGLYVLEAELCRRSLDVFVACPSGLPGFLAFVWQHVYVASRTYASQGASIAVGGGSLTVRPPYFPLGVIGAHKSAGHLLFVGLTEYFQERDFVYCASVRNVFDSSGYRTGGKMVCPVFMWAARKRDILRWEFDL